MKFEEQALNCLIATRINLHLKVVLVNTRYLGFIQSVFVDFRAMLGSGYD